MKPFKIKVSRVLKEVVIATQKDLEAVFKNTKYLDYVPVGVEDGVLIFGEWQEYYSSLSKESSLRKYLEKEGITIPEEKPNSFEKFYDANLSED